MVITRKPDDWSFLLEREQKEDDYQNFMRKKTEFVTIDLTC
jgi:hypothetical protein